MVKLCSLIVMFPRLCSKAATRWAWKQKTQSLSHATVQGRSDGRCHVLKAGIWPLPNSSAASWITLPTILWNPVTLSPSPTQARCAPSHHRAIVHPFPAAWIAFSSTSLLAWLIFTRLFPGALHSCLHHSSRLGWFTSTHSLWHMLCAIPVENDCWLMSAFSGTPQGALLFNEHQAHSRGSY